MNAKTSHKTAAIVLHGINYGESDRIVTFYTADYGKIKGIAKGARRSRKRFANALEPFSHGTLLFTRKNLHSLAFIENCDMLDHYPGIRADLDRTMLASYLIELTDLFTAEYKHNIQLFELLRQFLCLLDTGNCTDSMRHFFEMRLLKVQGYEPALDQCLGCRKPVNSGIAYRFSCREGGIRCETCGEMLPGSMPLSTGTIKTLLLGKEIEADKITRLVMNDRCAKESRHMLSGFISHLLGKEIKSLAVLNQIRQIK